MAYSFRFRLQSIQWPTSSDIPVPNLWRDTDLSKAMKSVLFDNPLSLTTTSWERHVNLKSFVIRRNRTSLTAIVESVEQKSEFLKYNLSDRPGRPLQHRGATGKTLTFHETRKWNRWLRPSIVAKKRRVLPSPSTARSITGKTTPIVLKKRPTNWLLDICRACMEAPDDRTTYCHTQRETMRNSMTWLLSV